MYNRTNPAVIKSTLRKMTPAELKTELEEIKSKAAAETSLNKRAMFLNLYRYASSILKSRAL